MEQIKIKYDGKWPNLCSGHLEVWIGETYYDFGTYILQSGGCIKRNEDWDMWTEEGDWKVDLYEHPELEPYKEEITRVVNENVEHGCCGGCI